MAVISDVHHLWFPFGEKDIFFDDSQRTKEKVNGSIYGDFKELVKTLNR